MGSIDKWFMHEVLSWRSGASVAWSVLTLPMITVVFTFLTCLQPFQPVKWIVDFSVSLVSLQFLVTAFLLMVINGLYFIYQRKTFTVIVKVNVSRVSHLTQLCRPAILVHAFICLITGAVLGWLCSTLLAARYGSLSDKCGTDSEVYCMNEEHVFLVLYGAYTGLMHIVYHYIRHQNVIVFPQVEQAKFFQVRNKIVGTMWSCFTHIVWQIKYFYILYYLFGSIPRSFIAEMLSLSYRSERHVDSLSGLLLDVGLLWQSMLIGVFIQLSWSIAALLYKVYNTQGYEFPISLMFENLKNRCLVDAMSCTSQPLLQALGFKDLCTLSKHSFVRRKELFSLSQPGGHPHNWTRVVSVCVSVLSELSDSVQEANWRILAQAPVRQGSTGQTEKRTASTDGSEEKKAEIKKQPVKERLLNLLKKLPVLRFFTSDSGQSKSTNLFASAFLQIWAVEALSALVSASFREDVYGVVQISLPEILAAMLNLQENVDKHFKLTGGVNRRVQKDGSVAPDTTFKYQLHASLKTSIYGVVNRFGKHLLDVGLPPDAEKKLHHFLEYRE